MEWGNKPTDGGNLFLTPDERESLLNKTPDAARFIKRFLGAQEFIRGQERYCLWIEDSEREEAETNEEIKRRIKAVAKMRSESKAAETRPAAAFPHRFRQIQSVARAYSLVVARVSSENREYLPIGIEGHNTIIGDRNFALYDAPLWNMALIASRLHWVWIGTVCVRMRTDFSYSNIPSDLQQADMYMQNLISLEQIHNATDEIIHDMLAPPDWDREKIVKAVTEKYGITAGMIAEAKVRVHYGDTEERVVKRVLSSYQEQIIKDTSEIFDIKQEISNTDPTSDTFRSKVNSLAWKYTSSLKSIDMANLSQIIVRRAAILEILGLRGLMADALIATEKLLFDHLLNEGKHRAARI
jgi:hypothetical protein